MVTAWIETAHDTETKTTRWRVVVEGTVVESGVVEDDVTGTISFERAAKLVEGRYSIAGWKHQLDKHASDLMSIRRTTTDRKRPFLNGWLLCKSGERVAVAVIPHHVVELAGGLLPCPVCNTPCRPTLEPAVGLKNAVRWNGAQWESVDKPST
jgi:hypothetical protein